MVARQARGIPRIWSVVGEAFDVPMDERTDVPCVLAGPVEFESDPGTEDTLLRIASTYERAAQRRISPPDSGPL